MTDYTTANRLPRKAYEELRLQAGRRGLSLASLVREAVVQYLGRSEEVSAIPFGEDPVDGLVGSISGPTNESVDHDHF